ncbi:MAG TPA: hypothetical protein VJB59_10635 [Bdellovibrionota bacterium]|nr:hypothetical protein [Bdellovibrionota bacterium]
MRWLWMIIFAVTLNLGLTSSGQSADFVVYSIYRGLDLGNPGEIPQKDYYVNMGSSQGIRDGMILSVHRRISTYDLLSEKLYRDVTFPIARLKVIHTEGTAAIARLDKMLPMEKTPSVNPFAVVVGDIVRVAE